VQKNNAIVFEADTGIPHSLARVARPEMPKYRDSLRHLNRGIFGTSRRQPRYVRKLRFEARADGFQVEIGLQTEPVLRRLAEGFSKPAGQFRRDRARSFDDVRDAHPGHADPSREFGRRKPGLFEDFREKFSGVDGGKHGDPFSDDR
jgi:hypothetical protein